MTSVGVTSQDLTSPSQKMPINGGSHFVSELENHDPGNAHTQGEINMTVDDLHRVTILNCPKDLAEPFNENQTNNTHGGCSQGEVITSVQDKEDKSYKISFGGSCVPILPWINGDGTTNKIIYKGLRRRVLGIVMQNPGILEVYAISLNVPLCVGICCLQKLVVLHCLTLQLHHYPSEPHRKVLVK